MNTDQLVVLQMITGIGKYRVTYDSQEHKDEVGPRWPLMTFTDERRRGPTMQCKVNLFPYLIMFLGLPHGTDAEDVEWNTPMLMYTGKWQN